MVMESIVTLNPVAVPAAGAKEISSKISPECVTQFAPSLINAAVVILVDETSTNEVPVVNVLFRITSPAVVELLVKATSPSATVRSPSVITRSPSPISWAVVPSAVP